MSDWQTLFERLVAIAFFGAGLWMLVQGLARLLLPVRELSWTPVPGKITESFVHEDADSDGSTYAAKLQYTYHYHGINFIGERIAPLQIWSSFRLTAESFTRKYPRGREVIVFVNPRNPGTSVLEPGRQVIAASCYSLLGAVLCTVAWLSTWMT
jgi:Protein of unknown function (DUF3592)